MCYAYADDFNRLPIFESEFYEMVNNNNKVLFSNSNRLF